MGRPGAGRVPAIRLFMSSLGPAGPLLPARLRRRRPFFLLPPSPPLDAPAPPLLPPLAALPARGARAPAEVTGGSVPVDTPGHGARDPGRNSAGECGCAHMCTYVCVGRMHGCGQKMEGEVVRRGDEGDGKNTHTHTNTHASRTAVLGPSSGPQALYRPDVRGAATKGCRRRARGGQQAAGDSHLPDEAVL
jgi:hypothetical protein